MHSLSNRRYLMSLAAPVLVVAAVFFYNINNNLAARSVALNEARMAMSSALELAASNLQHRMERLADDKAFSQNINWKLTNSVSAALTSYLDRTVIDQIVIFNRECTPLIRAASEKQLPLPCQPTVLASLKPGKPRRIWLNEGPVPALMILSTMSEPVEGHSLYAAGLVRLDNSWLSGRGDLARMISHRDYRFGVGGPDSGYASGSPPTVHPVHWQDELAAGDAAGIYAHLTSIAALLSLLSSVAGVMAIAAADRKRDKAHQLHVGWCKEAGSGSPGAGDAATEDWRKEASAHIVSALTARDEKIKILHQKIGSLERGLDHATASLRQNKRRLAELGELDSLGDQLARSSETFLSNVDQVQDSCASADRITRDEIIPRARALFEQMMEWQACVAEKGARKFIRSLSETPGRRPGESLLDQQIMTMVTAAAELQDHAEASGLCTAKASRLGEKASRIAALWHGIAQRTTADPVQHTDLFAAVQEAGELLHQDKRMRRIEVVHQALPSQGHGNTAVTLPALPPRILISSLYHCISAMAEVAGDHPALITVAERAEADRMLLVFQASSPDGRDLPPRGGIRQANHIEIARAVLSPFGMEVTVLPSLKGPYPVAVSWNRQPFASADMNRAPTDIPRTAGIATDFHA